MGKLGKKWLDVIDKDYKRFDYGKDAKKTKELLFRYVLHCPGDKGPELSKKFEDYAIKCSNDFKKLKKQILIQLKLIDKDTYYCHNELSGLEEPYRKLISNYKKIRHSFICFKKEGNSQLNTLYTKLRNVFAHGNFFIKNNKYLMWNLTSAGNIAFIAYLSYDELLKLHACLKFMSSK